MGDLVKGHTFGGASPANQVTAGALNALVDAATIQTTFFTGKGEKLVPIGADYTLIWDSVSGTFQKVSVQNLVPTGRAKTGFTNLQAESNTATQITVTADELLMRSATGQLFYLQGFNAAATLTTYSGGATAGGRDFATTTANSWVYFWAISDGQSNHQLLISASATAPTYPTNYIYSILLGAARCDNSTNFVRFTQRDCDVAIDLASAAGTASAHLNPYTGATPAEFTNVKPDTAKTLQTVQIGFCVPPIAGRVRGIIGNTDASGNYVYAIGPEGTTDITSSASEILRGLQVMIAMPLSAAVLGFKWAAPFEVLIRTNGASPLISWTANGTGTVHNMRITGYRLNL